MTYNKYYIKIFTLSLIITAIVIIIIIFTYLKFFKTNKSIEQLSSKNDLIVNKTKYKVFNKCYQNQESKLHAFVDNASKCNRILEDYLINQGLPKKFDYKECIELCRNDDKCVGGKYITDGKNKGMCYISSKLEQDSNNFDHFDQPTIAFSLDKPDYSKCIQIATSEERAMYSMEPKCNRFSELSLVGKTESHKECEDKCKQNKKCLGGIYYTSGDKIKKCYLGIKEKQSETEYTWLNDSGNVFYN